MALHDPNLADEVVGALSSLVPPRPDNSIFHLLPPLSKCYYKNRLQALPAGVFDSLGLLATLDLAENYLTALRYVSQRVTQGTNSVD